MNKWSDRLVKTRISKCLIDSLIVAGVDDKVLGEIGVKVEHRNQVLQLRKLLKSIKAIIEPSLQDKISEEINEIASDLKWKISDRGKYVTSLQDWIQLFHEKLLANPDFSHVFIGGHSSREIVYVVGHVQSPEVLKRLEIFLLNQNPPFPLLLDCRIEQGDTGRDGEIAP